MTQMLVNARGCSGYLKLAARNLNGSARDERAFIGSQKCDRVANFLRLAKSPQRDRRQHQFPDFVGNSLGHWRLDEARNHRIDSNSKFRKLFGRNTSERLNGRLRWRIIALTHISETSDNARDVHHGTAEFVLNHLLSCVLHHEICALCAEEEIRR